MHKLHALVETRLVVPVQVREVDLDPPQAALAERLRLVEQERVTAKVVTDVAQVGRDRVRAATSVEVVRQVGSLAQELWEKLAIRPLSSSGIHTARAISTL